MLPFHHFLHLDTNAKNQMKKLLLIWLVFTLTITENKGQSISGQIIDRDNQTALPYATVGFKGTPIGTITNGDGNFVLSYQNPAPSDQLYISYMGYESVSLPISKIGSDPITISLKSTEITLAEVVISPLSPEQYIRRVMRKQPESVPQNPYTATTYYREKFMENDGYIAFNEGIFKFHSPSATDTLENQYQLCLYETAKDPQELQFMKKARDKKSDRKQKKAEKKGEEWTDEDDDNMLQVNFGGPNEIIKMQQGEEIEEFLDTTKLKEFKYKFGTPKTYQGRDLLVINFESRGKVEQLRTEGKIYLDIKANALAGIEYQGEFVIPFVVDPILLAMGITISNPKISKVSRMQYLNGYWYPDYQKMDVNMRMTKRYMFSSNEKSKFDIDQVLKITDIKLNDAQMIPKEMIYNPNKSPEEQIFNDENWLWADFDKVLE